MKKLLLAMLGLVSLAWPAAAMKFESDREVSLERVRFVAEDWYAAGEQVTVFGNLLQDGWVAASRAQLAGVVGQDLNVLAVEAEIRGRVGDDLRVVAGELLLSATVEGGCLLVGRRIQVQNSTMVNGDLVAAGQDITVQGHLEGPATIYGQNVILDGVVAGPLEVRAESVTVGPEAQILGRLTVVAPRPAEVNPQAYVGSPVVWRKPATPASRQGTNVASWFSAGQWYSRITVYVGLLAFGLIMVLLLPGVSRRYAATIQHRFWPSLGWGLFTFAAVPILTLIFLITIIGIPLAVVLALFYVMAMFLARLGVGYLLGRLILRPRPEDSGRNALSLLLGFTLLTLAGWIPVLGGLLNVAAIFLGLGALWLTKPFVEPAPAKQSAAAPAAALRHPATSLPPAPAPVASRPATSRPTIKTPARSAAKPAALKPAAPAKSPAKMEWRPEVPAFMQTARKPVVRKAAAKSLQPAIRKPAVRKSVRAKKSTTKG